MRIWGCLLILLFCFPSWGEDLGQKANPNLQQKLEKAEESPSQFVWLPIVYYTPETSLAGGLLGVQNFWKAAPGKVSHVVMMGSVTTAGQDFLSVTPKFYFKEGHYELGGIVASSYFPDLYYGEGLKNLSVPEDYTSKNFSTGINAGILVFADLYLRGGSYYYHRYLTDIATGGQLQQDISSYSPSFQVLTNALSLEWDSRDYPQAPTSGALYKAEVSFSTPRDLQNVVSMGGFQKYELDLRQYYLIAPDVVWASQWLSSSIQGATVVPFEFLNTIGGGNRLRGYYNGYFRDKSLSLLQTEARYQWKEKWILAAFAGAAKLGPEFAQLNNPNESRLFATFGGGIRYVLEPENKLHLRFDVGLGAGGPQVYFVLGEAF